MRLRAAKINISEYLRPKGESTAMNYRASLNKYFQTIYPDLAAEWKPIARKPQHTQSYYDKLDDISLKYIEQDPEEHNFRQDLIEFKESMKDYATIVFFN